MPRKTKEQKEKEELEKEVKKATKKTSKKAEKESAKKTSSNKKSAKKAEEKPVKKTSSAKKVDVDEKKEVLKEPTAKKTATKKTTTKKVTAKKSATKSNASTEKKSTTKKSTTTAKKASSAKKTSKKENKIDVVEYYDLPYRYNQTVVKLLAQTPKTLFIYWDISDQDRENYKKQYGENFFETTKPILIVHNDTLNYSFEVEINDFANSWYLHVADSKCDYRIELGRKAFTQTEKLNTNDYVYVTTSNEIESPNDRILFDENQKMAYFRNVKTGEITTKSINNLYFLRNIGKIYNIYDMYKALYNDENVENIYDLSNPSSGNPSSSVNPTSGGML